MATHAQETLCIHAPTETELRTVEAAIAAAGPILAPQKPGIDGQHACALSFTFPSVYTTDSTSMCGSFLPDQYFSRLDSSVLGRVLFTAAATSSTQAIVQDNITRLPDGTVFVADRQIGGRGRGGNIWESPPGCLVFSACRRLTISGQRLPFVQYLVTLAVVQAAQAEAYTILTTNTTCTTNTDIKIPRCPLDLRIKWPNDIYSGGLKLGGILCHSSCRDGTFNVIMGVGFNLSNMQPTTCLDALVEQAAAKYGITSTAGELPAVGREALLASVMTRLNPMLDILANEGFAPFEGEYYDVWLHSGQRVEVEEDVGVCIDAGNAGGRAVVTIIGLSGHGYLLAQDDAGRQHELHPDGNSLDFFKGLIKRKLPA